MPKTKKQAKTLKKRTSSVTKRDVKASNRMNVLNENLAIFTNKLPSLDNLQTDLRKNQNILNLILGGFIVILLGVLVFNFLNKPKGDLVPANQISANNTQTTEPKADVTKENLPGQYTVKTGDTLYLVAQKYYGDGFLFNKIVEANKLTDPNLIEVGQTLTLPKVEQATTNTNQPTLNANNGKQNTGYVQGGTGGAENQTIWGERITGSTYTVQAGDWLSKISGRAYGDIYQFDKIAKANNIKNVDNIEPGTILKIPK